jgi:hypothetical protein
MEAAESRAGLDMAKALYIIGNSGTRDERMDSE